VIKEQISGMLAQDVCRLFREQRIGNDEGMGEIWRGHCSSFQEQLWGLAAHIQARERNEEA
jgi:hypothetical protein